MKISLATALTSLLIAGSALAAEPPRTEGLRIESEAQFVRDYGDRIEPVGPGVYLFVDGALAGKTVAIGEAGLAYDLNVQRQRLIGAGRAKARNKVETRAFILQLEAVGARYRQLHAVQGADVDARKYASGTFPCLRYLFGTLRRWNGEANVWAGAGLYLSNGGGGLNPYYAVASADASGQVISPPGVPASVSIVATVRAENQLTGQVVQQTGSGNFSAGASTGNVYSGPDFFHKLYAIATISGVGNCYGYVSISDSYGL